MTPIILDVHGVPLPSKTGAGLVGFISWPRLEQVLYNAKEVKQGERVVWYQLDDQGIAFCVRREIP